MPGILQSGLECKTGLTFSYRVHISRRETAEQYYK